MADGIDQFSPATLPARGLLRTALSKLTRASFVVEAARTELDERNQSGAIVANEANPLSRRVDDLRRMRVSLGTVPRGTSQVASAGRAKNPSNSQR